MRGVGGAEVDVGFGGGGGLAFEGGGAAAFDELGAGDGDGGFGHEFEHPALFAVDGGVESFDFVVAVESESEGFVDEKDEDEGSDGGEGGGRGGGDELFEELREAAVGTLGVEGE